MDRKQEEKLQHNEVFKKEPGPHDVLAEYENAARMCAECGKPALLQYNQVFLCAYCCRDAMKLAIEREKK